MPGSIAVVMTIMPLLTRAGGGAGWERGTMEALLTPVTKGSCCSQAAALMGIIAMLLCLLSRWR